jgi:hypothetical protein
MTFSRITRKLAHDLAEQAGPTLAWALDFAEELEELADDNLETADGIRQAAQHLRDAAFDRWYQSEETA